MARALLLDPGNLNMRYNIACAMIVNLRDFESALDLLGLVFENFGKERLEYAKTDADLDLIRGHPRYKAMMSAAEARLAEQAR